MQHRINFNPFTNTKVVKVWGKGNKYQQINKQKESLHECVPASCAKIILTTVSLQLIERRFV